MTNADVEMSPSEIIGTAYRIRRQIELIWVQFFLSKKEFLFNNQFR